MEIIYQNFIKRLESPSYNYFFNYKTGVFMRWGKTKEENPLFSPFGPEILDIEVSTVCHGIPDETGKNVPCKFCYKGNSGVGENMTLEKFKEIFLCMPKTLTQVAFGIGDIDANPDLFEMFKFCRENDYNKVVPNVTVNGWNINDKNAKLLSELCGAVSVSRYVPSDCCYNAVKTLTDLGMKQVNIHVLLSENTYEDCIQTIKDVATDPRLNKLNAVVFLMLKPHGRGKGFNKLSSDKKYKELIEFAESKKVRIGFDSCGAKSFLNAMKGRENYDFLEMIAEPCESSLFSSYVNVEGKYFPCSFCEGETGWEYGISINNSVDFMKDVWFSEEVIKFRNNLIDCLKCGKSCPMYDLDL